MKVQDRLDKNRVGELVCDGAYKYVSNFAVEIDGERVAEYDSLDAVIKEWKDYKEPETIYYITLDGGVNDLPWDIFAEDNKYMEEIGNYFKTREEAEKAIEKLKALKRLKDKGFEFNGYDVANHGDGNICGQAFYKADDYCTEDIKEDLDLLFSQEVKNETI